MILRFWFGLAFRHVPNFPVKGICGIIYRDENFRN